MQFAQITGLGAALPLARISSQELDAQHGLPVGTYEAASGVRQRPLAKESETQIALAGKAARAAMLDADVAPDDIDLILFSASVGHQPIPATAPLIQRAIGLRRPVPAYDLNATCLSALVALDHAAMAIETGRARTVLVAASEIASSALPWRARPETAGLFGDGAAALIVRSGDASPPEGYRFGPLSMETHSEGYEACQLRAGGTALSLNREPEAFRQGAVFEMDGRALYRLSSRHAAGFVDRVLARTGWSRKQVDLVVPHQASPHALAHIIKRCGFSREQVFDQVRDMGNLVAASLPVALFSAREQGRLKPGARVLLMGTSAGLSLGAMTLTIPAAGGTD